MRILFAAPDRDLIECYRKIFETDFGETVTAFDGAQVLMLTASESFDVAVLDRSLPRIKYGRVLERVTAQGIPVIALASASSGGENTAQMPGERAVLTYPFMPEEIIGKIRDMEGNPERAENRGKGTNGDKA